MNRIIACCFLMGLLACKPASQMTQEELADIVALENGEVIYEFDDKYPVSLMKKDSLLFVIQIQSDTCISVVDIRTKSLIASLGTVGKGDKDLMNPNFILGADADETLLNVANLRKTVRINHSQYAAFELESI